MKEKQNTIKKVEEVYISSGDTITENMPILKVTEESIETVRAELEADFAGWKAYVAILGPSGSGKTTLMNIIGCMDVMDSGEYYLDGRLYEE